MSPFAIATIVFACVYGAALLGMRLGTALPKHHLSSETKDAVRISMALVATMAALLLGLLIASAKASYDTQKNELMQMAAKVAYLDQTLSNYGPETDDVRRMLSRAVDAAIGRIWAENGVGHESEVPSNIWSAAIPKAIQELTPKDDSQRAFKTQAAAILSEVGQMRWLLAEQAVSSISKPLLIVLVTWLVIIFSSVGVFALSNSTVVVALLLAALSVCGAILLILELDQPFGGLVRISSEPMRNVLNHLK